MRELRIIKSCLEIVGNESDLKTALVSIKREITKLKGEKFR